MFFKHLTNTFLKVLRKFTDEFHERKPLLGCEKSPMIRFVNLPNFLLIFHSFLLLCISQTREGLLLVWCHLCQQQNS